VQIERLEAKPEVPEAELAEARTQADAARPLYEQVRCCLLPKTGGGLCNQSWLLKGRQNNMTATLCSFSSAFPQANSEALQSLKEVMARGEELLKNAATCVVETQEQIAKSFPGEL
jgi:hypothetical protein